MDILYKKLYEQLSYLNENEKTEFMEKSGYFITSKNFEDITSVNPQFVCTPFESVLNNYNLNSSKRPIVLLCTGSFAPMHDGHISMIKSAVNALNEKYHVLGVYISPGHDEYVLTKQGASIFNAEDRIQLAMNKIKEHNLDWMVDPWEALYTGCALNFTEVLIRLKKYLSFHVSDKIEVAFCFGADNAGFTNVLNDIPHVCISRNNIKHVEMTNKGIFVCHDYENISSTQIRKNMNFIQNTGQIALRGKGDLYQLLQKYYTHNLYLWDHISEFKENIINMDALSNDIFLYNIEISRKFILSDAQDTSRYINRPGSLSLKDQIKTIPPGSYILFDDDIHTGGTINYILSNFPSHIIINGVQTLIKKKDKTIDILDERDFIMNSNYGGLVVQANNKLWRVPYIMPFVNIRRRASLDNGNGRLLSLELLRYNKKLFSNENINIFMDGFFYEICKFPMNTLMKEVFDFYEKCISEGLA